MSPSQQTINAVGKPKMKWIKVPVAMDSGATANVSPNKIFGISIEPTEASKAKDTFFGVNGKPILNLGKQTAYGQTVDKVDFNIDFEICDISRPLGSVSKAAKAGNRFVIDHEEGSYMYNKPTKKKIPLREEGGLYFLDLWILVPDDMEPPQPFARQIQQS